MHIFLRHSLCKHLYRVIAKVWKSQLPNKTIRCSTSFSWGTLMCPLIDVRSWHLVSIEWTRSALHDLWQFLRPDHCKLGFCKKLVPALVCQILQNDSTFVTTTLDLLQYRFVPGATALLCCHMTQHNRSCFLTCRKVSTYSDYESWPVSRYRDHLEKLSSYIPLCAF